MTMYKAEVDENGPVGVVSILAFGCEVGMLALLAWAGWQIGNSTLTRLAGAVGFPVVAIVVWSLWMAPTSSTRLTDPGRLIAQLGLFVVVGVVVALSGPWWLGAGFAVVASVVFALSRSFA